MAKIATFTEGLVTEVRPKDSNHMPKQMSTDDNLDETQYWHIYKGGSLEFMEQLAFCENFTGQDTARTWVSKLAPLAFRVSCVQYISMFE